MHIGQATAPALYAKLPFDPVGDFAPIGFVTDVPMILVARANFPAKNLNELVAYVRTQGDKVTYGNVGLGSASHLCGLMFMSAIEAKLTPIYYKGGGPALNDIIAGHIDVYCDPATGPTPYIQAGTIPGYAITSKKRVPTLPNVPTSAEAGVPKFDVTTWYGLYAPRNTSKPIVDALVDALQKALKDPPLVNRFAELSMRRAPDHRADDCRGPAVIGRIDRPRRRPGVTEVGHQQRQWQSKFFGSYLSKNGVCAAADFRDADAKFDTAVNETVDFRSARFVQRRVIRRCAKPYPACNVAVPNRSRRSPRPSEGLGTCIIAATQFLSRIGKFCKDINAANIATA